ncbi:hypothetical protein [Spirillospora sp. CA-128828]|uniref:hypothetical protein n=1 Tax=Spirillospora sp. CA-128828 TaxID=3240033 RepID=UPI003D8E5E9F
MSVPPPAVPPPELRITLGRKAYRRPFRIFLSALAAGLLVSLSTLSSAEAWEPEQARRATGFFGGGCALVALAAAFWAWAMHRDRLVVTISEKGVALRRRKQRAEIPAGAVEAVGITWPVTDPVWTIWFDSEAAPGVDAVAKIEDGAVTLLRDRSLPSGWVRAAENATTEILGVAWRVMDDEGREVPPPPAGALLKADRVLVDGVGRYRDERGGALLAVAHGPLGRPPRGRSGFFPLAPGRGRRRIVLRDPHARTLLVFKRTSSPLGRDRLRVFDPDGRLLGVVRGRHEPSFHTTGGVLLGSTRQAGDRHIVTGVDGRRSATLRTKSGADDSRMWLERSPSAPEPLRALALALPMAVRIARQS